MIILTAKYTNNSGTTFYIRIYDREAESDSDTEFDCGPEFFRLKSEGDRNDTFKRIIPKTLQFKVLTGCHDYTETQVSEIATFYEALTTSFEGRFFVTVVHQGEMIFRGKILPDVGDFLMQSIGDFVVTAIDGITDLQDREYRPAGYSDLVDTFAIRTWTFNEHFIDIIRRIDTIDYFAEVLGGASTALSLVATANNWTETLSEAGDIWEQVRVRNYWFEQISEKYRKYQSCWDALTDLLTGFNAIMYYERGKYYIEQRSIQDNPPAGITYYHYILLPDEDIIQGLALTKTQHNYNSNDNLWAGQGATRGRLPAFKAIELEQGKQFTNFINGLAMSVPGNAGPFYLGYIIGEGNKLIIQWHCELLLGTAWSAAPYFTSIEVEWILVFKVQIGAYYMIADDPKYVGGIVGVVPAGQYHMGAGGTIPKISWTVVESTVTISWKRTIISTSLSDFNQQVSDYRNYVRNSALVIESNEIQANGDLTLELISFTTKRNGTTIGGTPPGTFTVSNGSRIIIASGYSDLYEPPKGIKRYEVGDVRNSIIYKTKLGYYDSNLATINQLFMSIEDNPLFAEYPTTEWTDPDAAITLPIEELMMKSMLSMRQRPARIYNLELYYKDNTYIGFGDQIVMYDAVTIPIEMEMIASGPGGYTTFKSILWEIEKDYLGVNVVDTGTPDTIPSPFPLPDGNLDASYNSNYPISGVEYQEEWENVSTAYVDPVEQELYILVDVADEYTPEIKQKWQVFINGVKQTYTPSGTLVMRRWRFDMDNNRILIVKGSGNIAHVEVIKYY